MIDWDRLLELRDEVGADDFDEVVDLFLEEVEAVTTRLRVTPDPATLESDLHFLKGSALNLGFQGFSELCQAGETNAANGRGDGVDLLEILTSYDTSKSEFLRGLQAQLAG
jgi:HPt (histidine-containing phosphotransfer) domain-containing protein